MFDAYCLAELTFSTTLQKRRVLGKVARARHFGKPTAPDLFLEGAFFETGEDDRGGKANSEAAPF